MGEISKTCPFTFRDKAAPFLLLQKGHLSLEGLMTCFREEESGESFQHLPFLKFLQLKIFNIQRCHIWGQHVLNPISNNTFPLFQKSFNNPNNPGTSLVAQWLRICLPMQGTRVRALVQEDRTCLGATKPMCHNY